MASVLMLLMVLTPSPVSVRRGGRVVVLALHVTKILTSVRYLTLPALSSFPPDYYHLIPHPPVQGPRGELYQHPGHLLLRELPPRLQW